MTEEESKEFQEFLKWKADQKKKEVKEGDSRYLVGIGI